MNIYVSGRIKDYPEHPQHFARGCKQVEEAGHSPVNPLDIGVQMPLDASYEDFMRADLGYLLDCRGIFMLEGWERSVGARCEHMVAAMCGIQIFYETSSLPIGTVGE